MLLSDKLSTNSAFQFVDRVTKGHLVLILYTALESRETCYAEIHSITNKFQGILERKYGITLGYNFNDVSIYPIWDNKFQEDINRWEGFLIDSKEELLPGGHIKLKPKLTNTGNLLVETNAHYTLERLLGKGSVERLRKDAKICVSK